MDPVENLREQAETAAEILALFDNAADDGSLTAEQSGNVESLAYRLAELVESLAEWNSKQ